MPVKVGLRFIEIWKSDLEKEVVRYEEENAPKGQIVFYGPSNFTRWGERWGMTPLREEIVGKSGAPCAINRGFGSSCSEHHLYYYSRMIRPLEPKVLVYSCYGNSESFGYTLEETWEIAQRVIAYALTDFPDIHVYICGANVRANMSDAERAKRRECNSWAREFAEKTPNCFYLDTLDYAPLNDPDIFVSDGVHFNQEGYHRYAEFFRQALKDELERF
jgi:hypothetical protein